MATVKTSFLPDDNSQFVTLTDWSSGDASFATTPVSNDQIIGSKDLTFGVDGSVTGPNGTYTLYHIIASSGNIEKVQYEINTPVINPILSQVAGLKSGSDSLNWVIYSDTVGGNLYVYNTNNPTETEQAIITNGTVVSPVIAGKNTGSITGLTPESSNYVHFVQVANGKTSNVISTDEIITDAAGVESATVKTSLLPPDGLDFSTLEAPIRHYIDQNWVSPAEINEQIIFDPLEFSVDNHLNYSGESEGIYSFYYINNEGNIYKKTLRAMDLPTIGDDDDGGIPSNNIVELITRQIKNSIIRTIIK